MVKIQTMKGDHIRRLHKSNCLIPGIQKARRITQGLRHYCASSINLGEVPGPILNPNRLQCIVSARDTLAIETNEQKITYLLEEWKEKQKETSEDVSERFLCMRFISLELPQQQNSYDCGLFLLHYVELFLAEAPACFSPFMITKFSKFLNVDWFQSDEVSLKRGAIQRLIYDLLGNSSREISPASASEKHCTSDCPQNHKDNEIALEFLQERCSPSKGGHGNLANSQANLGIEMTLLPTSLMRTPGYASDLGLVSRELFEPEVSAGSFIEAQYQAFDQTAPFGGFKSAMPPIEEEEEVGGHLVYAPSTEIGFGRVGEITSEACAFHYSSTDYTPGGSWNPGISLHEAEHHDNKDSSPTTSICASGDSFEVDDNEKDQVGEDLNINEKIEQPRSASTENIQCVTECFASPPREMPDIADSRSPDQMLEGNGDADVPGFCCQDPDIPQNGGTACSDGQLICDDSVSESDEQHAAKRMRITPSVEGEGLTISLYEDLHL
ncbi:unnamed protein product [Ilex paraguariensis]|uniref:Ubiquitin-like protease family profile domain-containing protein n=1 Tax=Ilex paraguariensis TaxID=185542 RepID=A0ABC8UZS3_9AQUA